MLEKKQPGKVIGDFDWKGFVADIESEKKPEGKKPRKPELFTVDKLREKMVAAGEEVPENLGVEGNADDVGAAMEEVKKMGREREEEDNKRNQSRK